MRVCDFCAVEGCVPLIHLEKKKKKGLLIFGGKIPKNEKNSCKI